MRVALAVLMAVASAVLALAALAAFNLRTFVDAHRDELLTRGERLLERPLRVGGVGPSWWPVGIRFVNVSIDDDPRFGAGAFLDAAAVHVTLRPWSLAVGRLEVSGVVLEAPHIRLVRDRRGRWNVATLGAAESRIPAGPANGGKPRRGARVPATWILGMAVTEVRNGSVDIEDLDADPPRRLAAQRVRVRAEDMRLGGAPRIRVDASLFPSDDRADAHLDVHVADLGASDRERTPFTARLDLRDVDLATVAAWNGFADGPRGRLATVSVAARGTLERGRVEVDAYGAETPIRLRPGWTLPGRPAVLRATVTYEAGNVTLEDGQAAFGALVLDASGSAELSPWRGTLALDSREGSALELTIAQPPMRLSDVALRLAMEGEVVRTEMARARLDGAPVACRAETARLAPLALTALCRASVFGGSLQTDIAVPAGSSPPTMRGEIHGVDVAVAVERLAPDLAGHLSGRAEGALALTLPVDGGLVARALTGSGRVDVRDGRLLDLSPLESVLGYGDDWGVFPRLLTARTRGRFPAVFEGAETPLARASVEFTVGGGRIVAERLVVATDAYELAGDGWIDSQRQLRLHGDLLLAPELSAALREDIPAARVFADSSGRLTVPFRARGRLGSARLEPDVKRVRERSVDALLARGRDRPPGAPPPGGAAPRVPDDPGRDDLLIERLERALRP
jgi:hypothetical protein